MGQGGQVAAGAHAALARHHGHDVAVQAFRQQVDGLGPDAAMALQEAVDAGGHEGAGLVLRQGLTHTGGMAADQVELEQLELVRGNDHRGELAEARVDAIDRAALGHDAVHHGAVLGHQGQSARVQGDPLARGDARQQGGGEGLSIEPDHAGTLRERVRARQRAKASVNPATV